MKILIDIGHPAHVHYFKNIARHFIFNNGRVLFTTRDKDVAIHLLKAYKFDFINFGKNFKSIFGKIWGGVYFTFRFFLIAFRFRPTFIFNASPYSAFVSYILRIPHISLEDTFNMEQVKLYLPFTKVVFTGDYYHTVLGKKEIKYSGYQELLYLHPNYFKPDPSILDVLGIKRNEKYVIIRFVSWSSSHDVGHKGISYENKIRAVQEFSKYGKVFITSEKELPDELKPYQIRLPPEKMHDAMSYASLIYGESATMVSEGAVLGVPGIFLDDTGRLYTKEQGEKYGLVFNFTESLEDQEKSIKKGVELLTAPGIKDEWQKRRERMLADKIDVAAFMVWFVENYPESVEVMKKNPSEIQDKFR
jgi:predicted glycosyltransferase